MGLLKNIWERIIVAFAQPATGKGASGMKGDAPHGDQNINPDGVTSHESKHGRKDHGGGDGH